MTKQEKQIRALELRLEELNQKSTLPLVLDIWEDENFVRIDRLLLPGSGQRHLHSVRMTPREALLVTEFAVKLLEEILTPTPGVDFE